MATLAALALALPLAAIPTAPRRLPSIPPDVSARMNALFARATPEVRRWADAEARKLRPLPPPDAAALEADARRGFPAAQPPLATGQAAALSAMAAYQVVNDLESEARLAPDADALARIAERKGAFVKLLSALSKKFSDADAAIVSNLK